LVNSEILPFNSRNPVIFFASTELILKNKHDDRAHVSGISRTLSELSKEYWIISTGEEIGECKRSFMMRKRRKAKAAT